MSIIAARVDVGAPELNEWGLARQSAVASSAEHMYGEPKQRCIQYDATSYDLSLLTEAFSQSREQLADRAESTSRFLSED